MGTFFTHLAKAHVIFQNPASALERPRIGRRLPRTILTAEEVEQVMAQPDMGNPIGVRDRAMLSSTGVRRQELIDLKLYDLDSQRGVILVREGKGKTDRMMLIGSARLRGSNALSHAPARS